jgi:hypothetical protein
MELKNLTNLKRENQSELYDLTKASFQYKPEVIARNYNEYIVDSYNEMRLDNISNDIYTSVDFVDFLCDLNNIVNPLSIKSGDTIIYVPENIIPSFRPETRYENEIREKISNKRKKSKVDPDRKKYQEDKSQSLPPTVTKKDYNPIKHKDGKIRIGDGIFKV